MIRIEKWDPDKHGKTVEGWLRARHNLSPVEWECFPPTGFVVDGCYAGFVYLTNSSVAYLDAFVSDPDAPKEARENASHVLIEELLALARQHRVSRVCGATSSSRISTLCQGHEFHDVPGSYSYVSRSV